MANEKILVVDDDKNICELLRLYLVKEGYNVTMVHDGGAALAEFDKLHPDLVLLDVMMPVMDGWEVCRKLRAKDNTPIIMLTAKGETYDKVLGLELGADDYIVKPFDAKEVTARIKAVLRRSSAKEEENKGVYDFDNLHLDMNRYELKVKGKVVEAPPKELELLACLAGHPNRVYTRDHTDGVVAGEQRQKDLAHPGRESGPKHSTCLFQTGGDIQHGVFEHGEHERKNVQAHHQHQTAQSEEDLFAPGSCGDQLLQKPLFLHK